MQGMFGNYVYGKDRPRSVQPKLGVNLHSFPTKFDQDGSEMSIPKGAAFRVPVQGAHERVFIQGHPVFIETCRGPPLTSPTHSSTWLVRAVNASLDICLCGTPRFRMMPAERSNSKSRADRTHRRRGWPSSWSNSCAIVHDAVWMLLPERFYISGLYICADAAQRRLPHSFPR